MIPCKEKGNFIFFHAFLFALGVTQHIVLYAEKSFPALNLAQLSVYADDDIISGGSLNTVKKKTEVVLVDSKEVGLEVNADKTKYMIMSRNQIVGQSHSLNTASSFFERVEQFKYFRTALKNGKSIQEKLRIKSGNACYRWVKNLLSCRLLSKNTNKFNSAYCLYGYETCSLTLREEHRLRVFENWVLKRIFGPKGTR